MGSLGFDLPHQILLDLEANGTVNSLDFAKAKNEAHQKIVGAIKSLESFGNWFKMDGEKLKPACDAIEDIVQQHMSSISRGCADDVDAKYKADYKKRKLIIEVAITTFEVKRGHEFTTSIAKQETELTKDLLNSEQWKNKSFKPFNFNAKGKLEQRSGHLHPLMQLRCEFRKIFLEMGFTEMSTNNYVESAFWDFDALFQPQQHPARDAHDTFYVADPEKALEVPEEYLLKVKQTHSEGGYGSIGYNYQWNRDEAFKNLLRTHTTAVSARLLYKIAQEGFKPTKMFSIDRVFRNETLDATHLAEFHQVEGVVCDFNLSVKNLMGIIHAFFEKIGIRNLRFKPTYNPYTEPSMEIFSFHEGLKKWVEIGNSGLFRPEMLRPMGLPENVSCIGFGLSLERPAMIMFGINNIRELVGPKVKMELILDNPVCTIDKFKQCREASNISSPEERLIKRQNVIIQRLLELQIKVSNAAKLMGINLQELSGFRKKEPLTGRYKGIVHDIVIYADPRWPPYSLLVLANALSAHFIVSTRVHSHSTVKEANEKLQHFWGCSMMQERYKSQICLTLIWKRDDSNSFKLPYLSVTPLSSNQVHGEHNIGRYLIRVLEASSPAITLYENIAEQAIISLVDNILDDCHNKLILGNNRERASFLHYLSTVLNQTIFLADNKVTLADPVVLSALVQLQLLDSSPNNVQIWVKNCLENQLFNNFL